MSQQQLDQAEAHLLLTGIDTFATLELNGQHVGSMQNLFREYFLPVKQLLKEGRNSLAIRISSAIQAAAAAKARYPYDLPVVTAPGGARRLCSHVAGQRYDPQGSHGCEAASPAPAGRRPRAAQPSLNP